MKRHHYWMIKIGWILLLLILIYGFLVTQFFPKIEQISQARREVKTLELLSSDFSKAMDNFIVSDEREEAMFSAMTEKLKRRIPTLRKRARESVIGMVVDTLEKKARKQGITNLVMATYSPKNGTTVKSLGLAEDQSASIFLAACEDGLREIQGDLEMDRLRDERTQALTRLGMGNIEAITISLVFTGNLSALLDFINHLPQSDVYIGPASVKIEARDELTCWRLDMDVFFKRGTESVKPDSDEKTSQRVDFLAGEKRDKTDRLIDFNSRILQRRLYHSQDYFDLPAREIDYRNMDFPCFGIRP